jgi:hypothetical protein
MQNSRNFSVEIKWILIFVVVQLLWFVGEKLFGLHSTNIDLHPVYTNFFAIPAILIYYLALREKKSKIYAGSMPWKEGFITGLVITFGVAVFSPIVQVVFHTIISPDYFQNAIDFALSNEAIEVTQGEAESYFSLGNYLIIAPVSAFFSGLLTSLIIPLTTRR